MAPEEFKHMDYGVPAVDTGQSPGVNLEGLRMASDSCCLQEKSKKKYESYAMWPPVA